MEQFSKPMVTIELAEYEQLKNKVYQLEVDYYQQQRPLKSMYERALGKCYGMLPEDLREHFLDYVKEFGSTPIPALAEEDSEYDVFYLTIPAKHG